MTLMTFETMFAYHPPNPRTTPRFDAVRQAEANALLAIAEVKTARAHVEEGAPFGEKVDVADVFPVVNAAALAMASVSGNAPVLGQLFTAAVERAVLFRNACNEALVAVQQAERDRLNLEVHLRPVPRLLAMATTYAQEYRWLANGAIAIGDAVHFIPEPTITDRSAP